MQKVVLGSLLLLAASISAQTFTTRTWEESLQLANELVANLTQAEKVGIVTGQGQFTSQCIGNTHAVNRPLPNAPNGLPSICLNDGPAGVRAVDLVTGFPAGINAASTFSRRLIHARGKAIAEEFRGKGIHVFLGPAMDLMRSPKAGRGWESFGPDPWLNGEAVFETINAVQSVGVQAVAKHFLGNIQEHYRYTYSSNIDGRTIHELYLWPFLRSIEAGVSSVMCAYNRFNETYACGNKELLDVLESNGFEGYVVSDWGATHPTTADYANAGLDMEQPGDFILIGGGIFGSSLQAANTAGAVSDARLNEMAAKVVASWFRLGQDQGFPPANFDVQNANSDKNQHVNVRSDEHTAVAKEVATASSVLLKNLNNALPLKGTEKTMALIGLDLKAPEKGCDLNACNEGTVVTGWGSGTISYDFVVPPIDSLQAKAASAGTNITVSDSNDLDAAAKAAAGKDVALVFVNAMSGELGALQSVDLNFGDRNNLALWNKGGSMIERVAAVNNNTIVVIHSTGPVLMGPWGDFPNVTAMIYAGAPGEQTGPAIVEVLYGNVNPSGRLPFTVAVNEDDYPADILYFDINPSPSLAFPETLFLDYRHFDQANIKPRFEFGYGLSYTKFNYSGLSISASSSNTQVSFTIANTGSRDGTEIPQLYVGFPSGSGEPPKVLRGFDDIALAVGESKSVTMSLNKRDLSIWDTPSQSWVQPSGTYNVFVGASSRDIRLQGTFTL